MMTEYIGIMFTRQFFIQTNKEITMITLLKKILNIVEKNNDNFYDIIIIIALLLFRKSFVVIRFFFSP